jgi:uncharacterized membrane protein YccC
VPPPPRAQKVSVRSLFTLRPGPRRWLFSARAACAIGLAGLVGWAAGDLQSGLIATIGAFTALYGGDRPYRNRAILLAVIACGFVICVTTGIAAAAVTPWLGVLIAALNAAVAAFLCSALRIGPPGAYMFALATAASTFMHEAAAHPLKLALFTAAGAAIAWVLQMAGALWSPRAPEQQAVAAAANAVAHFIEHAQDASHDLLRQATAASLHDCWATLVARQPAFTRADGVLHRLRALNRELHRLFGQAIVAANAGVAPDRTAAARAREIARLVADPPPVGPHDELHEPLRYIGGFDAIRVSLEWGSVPMRIAIRVGVAAICAGAIGGLLALDRAYWAIAAAVLILYQGFEWSRALQRALERIAGTFAGLLFAWPLLSLHLDGLQLVGALASLQFLIELLVIRNYALAAAFITPAALLIASGGSPGEDIAGMLKARGVDTIIGCSVGLVVLFLTSRRHARHLRETLSQTLQAAAALLPFLARRDLTEPAARAARRALRNAALDLRQLYEEQAGGPEGGRSAAVVLWPAVVAVQRLSFRILAVCWETEAAGPAASPPLAPQDAEAAATALAALAEGRGSDRAATPELLRSEIDLVAQALQDADRSKA